MDSVKLKKTLETFFRFRSWLLFLVGAELWLFVDMEAKAPRLCALDSPTPSVGRRLGRQAAALSVFCVGSGPSLPFLVLSWALLAAEERCQLLAALLGAVFASGPLEPARRPANRLTAVWERWQRRGRRGGMRNGGCNVYTGLGLWHGTVAGRAVPDSDTCLYVP